ncbi:hypothetical protein ACFL0P_01755 [Candidatus Omnitrophota bacterium]
MCLGESTTINQWPASLEEILNKKDTRIKFGVIDKGNRLLAGNIADTILKECFK